MFDYVFSLTSLFLCFLSLFRFAQLLKNTMYDKDIVLLSWGKYINYMFYCITSNKTY